MILHPEIWAFYSNHDEGLGFLDTHAAEAQAGGLNGDDDDDGVFDHDVDSVGGTEGDNLSVDGIEKKRRKKLKRKFKRHKSLRAKMKDMGVGNKIPQQSKTKRSESVHKVKAKRQHGEWVCNWSKKHIMEVWGSKTRRELANDEEKHARDLLLKYNGPFDVYKDALLAGDFQQTHSGDPP